MRLARFKTVRGRLLALLVAIVLPIAFLTAIAAITTYRTVIASIQTFQARTADDFAVRTRVWYRGALRSLLATGTTLAAASTSDNDCGQIGHAMLEQVIGYRAVQIRMRDGRICSASLDDRISAADLASSADSLKERQAAQVWGGAELARARYDQIRLAGQRYLAVYAQSTTAGPMRDALLLTDPDLLNQVFDVSDTDTGMAVALVNRGGDIITSRGMDEQDDSWLPAQEIVPQRNERWEAPSRKGVTRSYAARPVAEPDLYVIASFDDTAERAARTQFLALLLTPLLTLALLCVVYLRAIDRHCVRWLRGIEAAARARATLSSARAAIADDMPSDIRSVADAFNTMVDDQEVRQRRLQTALDDNRFLVRELHHRVKNSLQVVQSYIGLSKRDYRGEAKLALSDAECRVHVLSAAYRFTLADGEMQPVRVDLFLDDVMTMISNLIRRRDQWVTGKIETVSSLSVDRIIPLGFMIVDVVSRALRSTPEVSIAVLVRDIDAETIEVTIEADREIAYSEPPKLFAGLLAQIEAVQVLKPNGRTLGSWQVVHRG
jgi:two-component sensor histidine kinase